MYIKLKKIYMYLKSREECLKLCPIGQGPYVVFTALPEHEISVEVDFTDNICYLQFEMPCSLVKERQRLGGTDYD